MSQVDVIVPCYNYGRFLQRCVDSVLGQDGCSVRVLVIDDCSTDDSRATAEAIAARDPRVTLIAHERNRGHIATYNEGIDWVSAEYMLLLSADDMLAPGAFARATGLMAAHPAIALAHGRSIRFCEEAEIAAQLAPREAAERPIRIELGARFIRRLCERPINTIETATAVVRTAVQKRVGGYRPELPHSGDLEMWLRLAAEGDIAELDAVQAFTRVHGNNMHTQYVTDGLIRDYAQRAAAYRHFFAARPRPLPDQRMLEHLAVSRLGEEVYWAASNTLDAGNTERAMRLARLAREINPAMTTSLAWMKLLGKIALGVGPARRLGRLAGVLRARGPS